MTARQHELVRDSFEKLRPIPKGFGLRFYERLFLINPSYRALFKGDLEKQATMFVTAIALAVTDTGDGAVSRPIHELGERHGGYGIGPQHFAVFGEALMWTLSETLGADFTPEVREAWTAAYKSLAASMQQAASDAKAAEDAKGSAG